MPRETLIRTIAVALALAGLLILWQSTVWGLKAVPGIIQQLGSVSGDAATQAVYTGPVVALRTIGAVLLGVGLFRALEQGRKA